MQIECTVNLKPVQQRRRAAASAQNQLTRTPNLVRLLVLAHQIEQTVAESRAVDYVDVAAQLGLTRARISQITNLLFLSPTIQTMILTEPERVRHISERQVRQILNELDWQAQENRFRALVGLKNES